MNVVTPILIRDGVSLQGEEITAYHRKHMTGSYHCIYCGTEMPDYRTPCQCYENHLPTLTERGERLDRKDFICSAHNLRYYGEDTISPPGNDHSVYCRAICHRILLDFLGQKEKEIPTREILKRAGCLVTLGGAAFDSVPLVVRGPWLKKYAFTRWHFKILRVFGELSALPGAGNIFAKHGVEVGHQYWCEKKNVKWNWDWYEGPNNRFPNEDADGNEKPFFSGLPVGTKVERLVY